MPTALVRNGRVVTASESYEADLYVDGGRIALVGQGLSLPADTVIDASGCLVLPGGIDVHTHLDLPTGKATSADDSPRSGSVRRRSFKPIGFFSPQTKHTLSSRNSLSMVARSSVRGCSAPFSIFPGRPQESAACPPAPIPL